MTLEKLPVHPFQTGLFPTVNSPVNFLISSSSHSELSWTVIPIVSTAGKTFYDVNSARLKLNCQSPKSKKKRTYV